MKIILAYSGGLEATVALAWLKETYDAEVIAFCADIGQGDELRGLEKKATKAGASKVHIEDLQEEFARDYIFPVIQAGALGNAPCSVSTGIARALIAKRTVDAARQEKARTIAHGITDASGGRLMFELSAAILGPELQLIAPWRDNSFRSEFPGATEMLRYCEERKIPVAPAAKKPFASDGNLLQSSVEGGILDDLSLESGTEEMYPLTVSPEAAPDKPETVTLEFEKGQCTSVNGKSMPPVMVMKTLNRIGGKNGIGRVDLIENRSGGTKARCICEIPGGAILRFAHSQIESMTLDSEVARLRDSLVPKYVELVQAGCWFSPERQALQALVTETQKNVSGTIRLKLYKGNTATAGRKSVQSLYRPGTPSKHAGKPGESEDDAGVMRLNALRLKVASHLEQSKRKQG